MTTDAEIEEFVRAFEDGTFPRAGWTHARHLVMALWYLRRHERDRATALIRDGIRRYNAIQGNPTGYHETVTLAWVAVIDRFLGERGRHGSVSSLARELLADYGDKDYLLRFYTGARLFSDEARVRWLRPDLAEIDRPVRGPGEAGATSG